MVLFFTFFLRDLIRTSFGLAFIFCSDLRSMSRALFPAAQSNRYRRPGNSGRAAAFINVCVNQPAYLSLSHSFSSASSRYRHRVKRIQLYQCFGTQKTRFTTESEAASNILITSQLIAATERKTETSARERK